MLLDQFWTLKNVYCLESFNNEEYLHFKLQSSHLVHENLQFSINEVKILIYVELHTGYTSDTQHILPKWVRTEINVQIILTMMEQIRITCLLQSKHQCLPNFFFTNAIDKKRCYFTVKNQYKTSNKKYQYCIMYTVKYLYIY